MKVALYARVSTVDKDQNPEVQLKQLREYCGRMDWEIYKEYVDQASAVDLLHRTAWTQLMKDASTRRFELVLVWRLSRAFRSRIHAHNSLEVLQRYKVDFRSYSEPSIDTGTMAGKIILDVLAALAEGEREEIRENVLAGMAYAKEHGTKSGLPVGRPRVDIGFTKVCKALRLAEFSYTEAAKALNKETGEKITPGFIYNRVKREADVRGVSMEELKAVIANEGTRDNGTL
jgi:DNA invertase Pin-like site-specific DNA recombinase